MRGVGTCLGRIGDGGPGNGGASCDGRAFVGEVLEMCTTGRCEVMERNGGLL